MKRRIIAALFLLAASSLALGASADDARRDLPRLAGAAPDFQFQGSDGRWSSLGELRAGGHVLLVFEPSDAGLAALEREADSLRARGVRPVAVFRGSDRDNWSRIERLGLTYSLLSDPNGEVAAELEVADAGAAAPAWCLVDRDGRVRGRERGALPATGLTDGAGPVLGSREQASALGAPQP